MNCWKTINITKEYGSQRIFILSSLTALLTFILLYVPITYLSSSTSLDDRYFFAFAAGVWLMYPVHKVFHFLPVSHLGKGVKKTIYFKYGFFPLINIRVTEPIPKRLFLFALMFPFIVINVFIIVNSFIFPHYIHYFAILLAFHAGLCVSDFICAKNIFSSPRFSYIEENEEGFEILVFKGFKKQNA